MFNFGVVNINFSLERKKRGYSFSFEDKMIYRDNFPINRQLELINHSPLGLNWGYNGAGSLQSSFAILYDFTKDEEFSLQYYKIYCDEVVSNIPQRDYFLKFSDIQYWIDIKNQED